MQVLRGKKKAKQALSSLSLSELVTCGGKVSIFSPRDTQALCLKELIEPNVAVANSFPQWSPAMGLAS